MCSCTWSAHTVCTVVNFGLHADSLCRPHGHMDAENIIGIIICVINYILKIMYSLSQNTVSFAIMKNEVQLMNIFKVSYSAKWSLFEWSIKCQKYDTIWHNAIWYDTKMSEIHKTADHIFLKSASSNVCPPNCPKFRDVQVTTTEDYSKQKLFTLEKTNVTKTFIITLLLEIFCSFIHQLIVTAPEFTGTVLLEWLSGLKTGNTDIILVYACLTTHRKKWKRTDDFDCI